MRTLRRAVLALPAGALAILAGAPPARAHAFGPRYDLPLPLDFYLAGAGGAVALSFVVMALVFRARPPAGERLRVDLLRFGFARALLHPVLLGLVRALSVALFLLVLAAGLFGNQDTVRNFAPTFVWIIWWVGLAYLAALIGNPWPLINPWSIVFAVCEKLAYRLGLRKRSDPLLAAPAWLGVWPAVLLFGLFAWFELIHKTAQAPSTLAGAILVYSLVTWSAMAAFGRETWLARGEAFQLAFGVFERFAPLGQPLRDGAQGRPRHWYLRPHGSALVVSEACRPSMTVFVLLMLATVTFDGFKETPLWGSLLRGVASAPSLHPLIRGLHDLGFDFQMLLETAMLALFPLLFLAVYLGFCWLTKLAAGSRRPLGEIAGLFVFSLVPIAIAYHLAHYLSYLLVAGQLIIPLASDPFGLGWDLFGTAYRPIQIGVVGAKFVWYSAVIAIVVGHVFAVGVAHFVALKVFETARAALKSQLPFLILMVAYTMVSLWILAQPIVGGPDLSTLRAPSGRITLAAFEFRELCLPMRAGEDLRYDFRSDQPVEFDIHYHQGLSVRFPVRVTATTAQDDRFTATRDRDYCLMWFNRSLLDASLTYKVTPP